ncbi:MAG: D-glycero-beta-D-manno-heptose-7-phosphate kinase [Desulfuromonadales bacterium]
MTLDRLQMEAFLTGIPHVRILVIGDLMLDEYIWGAVDRISPEAPVQIVEVKRRELRLGGAGNVINNLLTLNGQVNVASVVGDDDDGRILLRRLMDFGMAVQGVFVQLNKVTSRKSRVFASNQQIVRIDHETREDISPENEERLIAYVKSMVADLDVIYLSDYQKGVLTDRLSRAVIALGREADVAVMVDPKGNDFQKYHGATLLTPNRKEAQSASGITITDEASLLKAGRKLLHDLALEALVITRSEEGMTVFSADGETHLPTVAREVYDVSGAGDTVFSLFGLGVAQQLPFASAARFANLGAGIVVGKVGTSTVSPQEMMVAVGLRYPATDQKITSLPLLENILAGERHRGKKIVFTNGCFDLLHVGHVRYLQEARQLGDLLILGLNSDDSIRRLKGPNRPLIGEEERAHILAALNCIDYVVVFDEDTPLELIKVLRPQVLVKGGDYTPDEVVGKDLVESWGGRVELVQLVAGKSTSRTIDKILEQYREK